MIGYCCIVNNDLSIENCTSRNSVENFKNLIHINMCICTYTYNVKKYVNEFLTNDCWMTTVCDSTHDPCTTSCSIRSRTGNVWSVTP